MLNSLELVSIPPQDEALRADIKTFIAKALAELSADSRARSWQGFNAEFSAKLGRAGFIGLSLPKRYGGSERGPFARFVVLEELLAIGAPVAAHWIADRQSAQLLLRFGSEAQRQKHLPAICRGEQFFCIGMSEPGSGSDLASVRTRATQNEDGSWCLRGAKIWTSNGLHAHYMIALVRTSGELADKHEGLSQVLIDLSLPGVTVKPILDISGDAHFCEVHFDAVELSADALIGNEGDGWTQVTAELVLERSGPERIYSSMVLLDRWVEQLQECYGDTSAPQAVLITLGHMVGELAVLRSMSLAVTACLARGESPAVEATLIKDLGTSFEQRIPELILELLGLLPENKLDAEFLRTLYYVAEVAPSFSLRGGTREILRGIIARGLGLRKGASR